ncbi:MAG: hypothetical protein BWK77_04080 [Verrucomicrobia bacterium A1]|nr:MAG: hypothetical protein BWK77_04080 [Verrucomicrobia bacterium A1]
MADTTRSPTFPCARCKTPIAWPANVDQVYESCLACGAVNRVPVVEEHHRVRNAVLIVILLVLLVAICWTVTVTLGGEMIQPEISATLASMKVGPDTVLHIRAPVPLVVSFRVTGTQVKSGIRIGLSITKYYFWYFSDYREIPETQVPPVLKWVWAY